MNQLSPELSTRFVIVTPVRDEEQFVEKTIRSVLEQTVKPLRWIIVDDGSRDRTPEIIRRLILDVEWIKLMRIERDGQRDLGITEIRAFAEGYRDVRHLPHDFVVKLDADLELPRDYFEKLIERFEEEPALGIASGAFLERRKGRWVRIRMPDYHASGASKMVRVECFNEIGGYVLYRGWDTVDEIRAQARGWKTRRFQDLPFFHLKREGSASGFVRTGLVEGEVYYLTGGGKLFLLLKLFHRIFSDKPPLLAALVMLWGALKPWLTRKPRLVTENEVRLYRNLQTRRMLVWLRQMLGWLAARQNSGGLR